MLRRGCGGPGVASALQRAYSTVVAWCAHRRRAGVSWRPGWQAVVPSRRSLLPPPATSCCAHACPCTLASTCSTRASHLTELSPHACHHRGRNTEGQCGVQSYLPLLLQAREVEGLAGLPLASLAAGKTHSAAVLESGEAFTWGEGGDGKLGHGCTGAPPGAGGWLPAAGCGALLPGWAGAQGWWCQQELQPDVPTCAASPCLPRPWPAHAQRACTCLSACRRSWGART